MGTTNNNGYGRSDSNPARHRVILILIFINYRTIVIVISVMIY